MSAPGTGAETPLEASGTARLSPSRDGRLVPYGLIAFGGLGASLLFGQSAFAVLAVPFAAALALGLRRRGPVEVTARLVVDSHRVPEGGHVTGRIEIEWDGTLDARITLHRLRGTTPSPSAEVSWWRPRVDSVELPIHLEAVRWGEHALGEVWLRLKAPFGLLSWTGKVLVGPPIKVLPEAGRLDRMLHTPDSRAVWGLHRSTRLGEGHEFAEVHPYVPGDRLRDLNWAATARLGRPFVNRRHAELSGDVVIAVDAPDDRSRAARAAWALATLHLRANDRVGLMGMGASTQWLPPTGGRHARYQLMDALLRIGGEAADPATRPRRRRAVPTATLVVALTPLQDRATLDVLETWRAHGRSVAVLVIEPGDLLEAPESPAERLARRLWTVELGRRRRELRALGIPVVTAPADGPLEPAVLELRRAQRAPSVGRRR